MIKFDIKIKYDKHLNMEEEACHRFTWTVSQI
jgi:hypothetical protein